MLCMHASLPESPKWLLMKASQSKSSSTNSEKSVSNILVSVNDGINTGSQNLVEDRQMMSRVYNLLKGMRTEGIYCCGRYLCPARNIYGINRCFYQ